MEMELIQKIYDFDEKQLKDINLNIKIHVRIFYSESRYCKQPTIYDIHETTYDKFFKWKHKNKEYKIIKLSSKSYCNKFVIVIVYQTDNSKIPTKFKEF